MQLSKLLSSNSYMQLRANYIRLFNMYQDKKKPDK